MLLQRQANNPNVDNDQRCRLQEIDTLHLPGTYIHILLGPSFRHLESSPAVANAKVDGLESSATRVELNQDTPDPTQASEMSRDT